MSKREEDIPPQIIGTVSTSIGSSTGSSSETTPRPPLKIRGVAFEEAYGRALHLLGHLFPKDKKPQYHEDFAQIIAFMSDPVRFKECFIEVNNDTAQAMKNCPYQKNKLTSTFFDLFERYGSSFPRVQNVVLVGSAFKVFGAIVSNGLHFKDGTGPGHGEYSHTIQWLVIAKAKQLNKIVLAHDVPTLYRNTAGGKEAVCDIQLLGQDAVPQTFTYWNVLVDCFQEGRLSEDGYTNLMSSSYRSPGYLTSEMLYGELREWYLGVMLQLRYKKRANVSGKAESLRQYHLEKQKGKDSFFSDEEGIKITVPAKACPEFLEVLQKRKVKLAGGPRQEEHKM